ncbi:PLATZ transcription factor [Dillenia turbinata]|uniref:PLATZ transcription factor n=1 Tax=Dillenia turbinata TaxID=194707 RepID=A0AAN8UVS6_9MAGN
MMQGIKNWLSTLLETEFFVSCEEHENLRKNEVNVLCVDCNLSFCRHCLASSSSSHDDHRRLQICKYVYRDVVRLHDIQKLLNCSKIQTYKINGEKALHLNPRPQSNSTKPKTGPVCEACGRHIQELANRFCSIACKFGDGSGNTKDRNQSMVTFKVSELDDFISKQTSSKEEEEEEEEEEASGREEQSSISLEDSSEESPASLDSNPALKPKKMLNKRKCIPRRAPYM